jgi:hypothetical protein
MNDTSLQQKRLIAAVIDIGIGFVLAVALAIVSFVVRMVIYWTIGFGPVLMYVPWAMSLLGTLVCGGYILGRDLLGGGRSLGKKTQDLKVVTVSGGTIGPMESARRNAIFALGLPFGLLSAVMGLLPCLGHAVQCLLAPLVLLGALASVVAAVVEIIKITQDPAGIRYGDQFARTKVVRA